MHLNPAEYVTLTFGGVRKTARAIGRHYTSVIKWRAPRERKGCGGEIPSSAYKPILEAARARGLDISTNDLVYGREATVEQAERWMDFLGHKYARQILESVHRGHEVGL